MNAAAAPMHGMPPLAARDETRLMAVVGLAHSCSHFFHLILAPLFPWLREEFALSYSELGLLMTVFFVVSGVGQAIAGFVVDRVGPFPVLVGAMLLFVASAAGFALSHHYATLMVCAALAGLGNAPFHPVDYSILNARISVPRLGRAYAIHGITGSLGWAAAPAFLIGLTGLAGWRVAMAGAALLALVILVVVWFHARLMSGVDGRAPASVAAASKATPANPTAPVDTFGFLRLPAVWFSFAFFFGWAVALGGVQSFGPEAARSLHEVPLQYVAVCLTVYMLGSAGGMLVAGFTLSRPERCERIIATSLGSASVLALLIGFGHWPAWMVPVLFALMGFGIGTAGPSRDLLVRRAAPPGATGRVYGLVYSGLDAGMAIAPAAFGLMMDRGHPIGVWIGIAVAQAALILSAVSLGRRAPVTAPPATA